MVASDPSPDAPRSPSSSSGSSCPSRHSSAPSSPTASSSEESVGSSNASSQDLDGVMNLGPSKSTTLALGSSESTLANAIGSSESSIAHGSSESTLKKRSASALKADVGDGHSAPKVDRQIRYAAPQKRDSDMSRRVTPKSSVFLEDDVAFNYGGTSEASFYDTDATDSTGPLDSMLPRPSAASTWHMVPLVLLYFTACEMLDAVNPKFVLDTVQHHYDSGQALSVTARWEIVFSLCITVPAFLTVAFYGGLSDRFGRRFVLMVHIAISVCAQAAFTVIAYHEVHVRSLVVGYLLLGICGSHYTFLFAAFSYCADCTSLGDKLRHFGWIEAACFAGHFVGPYLGGWMYDSFARWSPYCCSTILLGLCIGYVALIPESLSVRNRSTFALKKANPFASMAILFQNQSFSIFSIMFACVFAAFTLKVVTVLYFIQKFHWSTEFIGGLISITWLCRCVTVLALLPLITHLTKGSYIWNNMLVLRISMVATFITSIGLALAPTPQLAIAAGLVSSVGSMFMIAVRATFCTAVSPKQQGAVLSAIATMELVVTALTSPAYDQLYAYTVNTTPALFFVCGGMSCLVGFTISWLLKERDFAHDHEHLGMFARGNLHVASKVMVPMQRLDVESPRSRPSFLTFRSGHTKREKTSVWHRREDDEVAAFEPRLQATL